MCVSVSSFVVLLLCPCLRSVLWSVSFYGFIFVRWVLKIGVSVFHKWTLFCAKKTVYKKSKKDLPELLKKEHDCAIFKIKRWIAPYNSSSSVVKKMYTIHATFKLFKDYSISTCDISRSISIFSEFDIFTIQLGDCLFLRYC